MFEIFFFGPPQAGLGGLDLAAININRGRERGLPDFNTIRQDFGLSAYTTFSEINENPDDMATMETLYGDINNIDPWVGMLAEDHMPNALFGETIMKIMEEQFFALREGDRFYYENDPVLSQIEKEDIRNTTFRDIIMRNTGITVMQMNVFEAMDHDSICPAQTPFANILGGIQTIDGDQVEGVDIAITYQENGFMAGNVVTGQSGGYVVEDLETCDHYNVTAEKDYNHVNGVSTFDLIFIKRHILQTELLDNPYKALSADVNNDGNISTIDMVEARKVILFIQDTFTNNKSWRFIDENITFADPNNPVEAIFDQTQINYLPGDTEANFIGLKIGDVTGNADPAGFSNDNDTETRNDYSEIFTMTGIDKDIEPEHNYAFTIRANGFENLAGAQFALQFDKDALTLNEVIPGDLTNLSSANFAVHQDLGAVSVSWDTDEVIKGSIFFTVNVSSKTKGALSEFIKLNSQITKSEAYTSDLEIADVELVFENNITNQKAPFDLFQNTPNPFNEQTNIHFTLPTASEVELVVYDLSGKALYQKQGHFTSGFNGIQIDKSDLNGSGILYYQLNTIFGSKTRRMIMME